MSPVSNKNSREIRSPAQLARFNFLVRKDVEVEGIQK